MCAAIRFCNGLIPKYVMYSAHQKLKHSMGYKFTGKYILNGKDDEPAVLSSVMSSLVNSLP